MKLYFYETDKSRRVCAVAKHLGSDVEFVHVDLRTGKSRAPEFLHINPNGKVPVLVDGELTLTESDAIMAHLAVKAGSDLWPSDSARQIEVLRWLSWNTAHFTRYTQTIYFEHYVKPKLGGGPADPSELIEPMKYVKRYAAILDAHLAQRTWLIAEQLSIADFSIATCLAMDPDAHQPIAGFDNIKRWLNRLNEFDSWRDPFPVAA